MLKIVKKIIIASISLVVSISAYTPILANDVDEAISRDALYQYFDNYMMLSGEKFDLVILDEDILYDSNKNPIGYLYDFKKNETIGYAITLNIGDEYIVNEVAYGLENPYNSNDEKIYLGLFEYYQETDQGDLYNVVENTYLAKDTAQDIDILSLNTDLTSKEKTSRIAVFGTVGYPNNIEYISQSPDWSACTPTSAAMIVRYYYNRGLFDWKSKTLTNNQIVANMKVAMGTIDDYGTEYSKVIPGFKSFMTSYTDTTVTGTTFMNDVSKIRKEIDESRPFIITVHMNQIVPSANYDHSMMAYSYWTNANQTAIYVKVKEPGNSIQEREFLVTNSLLIGCYSFKVN